MEEEIVSDVLITEQTVKNFFAQIGVCDKLSGARYLVCAIMLVLEDSERLYAAMTKLYPAVARQYGSTVSCVEKAMRTCIGRLFETGDYERLEEVFGYTVSEETGKPTNTEFISLVADYLRLRYNIT